MNFPNEELRDWFLDNQRDLPWRKNPTPYRVWISEVMLQQTQSSVVIPYFEKWMELFPDIFSLASASLEEVIKCWEGLGYYSRARFIHEAAKQIVFSFAGHLPEREEDLKKIKGLGPYTIGAILSFAFHQKKAAVDGNVVRVLTRFFAYEDFIDTSAAQKEIWKRAQEILPNHNPWEIVEGLIELGAVICKKKPLCLQCPLRKQCLGYQRNLASELPKKQKKSVITQLYRAVGVIFYKSLVFVKKGERGKVMSDLYEFPYIEVESDIGFEKMIESFSSAFEMDLFLKKPLPLQKHHFTRYQANLYPFVFEASQLMEGGQWIDIVKLQELPFSSGHKRILKTIL